MSAANASSCTIASSQSCPGIMSRPQQGRACYRVAAPRTRAAQTRRVERTSRGQLLIPGKTASTALVAPGMHGCVKAESAWSVPPLSRMRTWRGISPGIGRSIPAACLLIVCALISEVVTCEVDDPGFSLRTHKYPACSVEGIHSMERETHTRAYLNKPVCVSLLAFRRDFHGYSLKS
jgi:hypothetical protein